ncbi:MAG TPA: phosphatase PAP2 family protein [Ktedonobacterales bacterium]|nr:phosphatase PAP2 family protein [Ktedonobacterales bacterium]
MATMKQQHNEPEPDDLDNKQQGEPAAKERIERAVDAGARKVRLAQAQVAREREPRWRILARGRVLLVVYIIVLIVVGLLAFAAHNTSVLPGDLPFTRELQESKSPIIAGLFYYVSALGFTVPSAAIEIVALLTLWLLRLRLEAIFLALSLLADLFGLIVKIVVGRQRPSPDLVHVVQQIQQPSFPSGHTLHYTVFYGFLIFITVTNFRPSWLRTVAIVAFALLIALVGPSRVYLGEHWPTDVVGGYLIGALCLAPLIAGYLWAKAHLMVSATPPWIHRIPPAIQPTITREPGDTESQ